MPDRQTWFCAQLGGREHFAIPRALFAAGALGGLMTDYWAGAGTKALAGLVSSKATRSLRARCHTDIPNGIVKSWNLRALAWEGQLRRMTKQGGVRGRYLGFCEVGRRFAEVVVRSMQARRRLPERSVFFGYDTCSLEVMEFLKGRGVACIVDQIDPCRLEVEMVRAEQQAWPGWEDGLLNVPEEFYLRHTKEWALADRVVVNSEWSRLALIQQGVPPEKLAVIPLCFEADAVGPSSDGRPRASDRRPLKVLFLGQVVLRKGIQYLVEAARMLQHEPVQFDVVGPIYISKSAVSSAPPNLRFHGRATRDQINNWYRSADVFALPTLSDGFAITQIEAMANGLPVIATPNCGDVVSNGVDGFIVPPRDSESLARVIHRYLEEPGCLENQGIAALLKSKQFSLARVGEALLGLGREMHGQVGRA